MTIINDRATARRHLAEALSSLDSGRDVRAGELIREAMALLSDHGDDGLTPDELNASNDD